MFVLHMAIGSGAKRASTRVYYHLIYLACSIGARKRDEEEIGTCQDH